MPHHHSKIIIYAFGASRHSRPILSTDTVWTLNKYWENPQKIDHTFTHVKPHKIFQIHDYIQGYPDYNKFKAMYDTAQVPIVVLKDCGFARQEYFDLPRYAKDPELQASFKLGSTLDYMMLYAYWEGIETVELLGADFNTRGEYINQMPTTIKNVEYLRSAGLKIIAPQEKCWRARFDTIKWQSVPTMDAWYGYTHTPGQPLTVTPASIPTTMKLVTLDIK